jgi:hypothetical protein
VNNTAALTLKMTLQLFNESFLNAADYAPDRPYSRNSAFLTGSRSAPIRRAVLSRVSRRPAARLSYWTQGSLVLSGGTNNTQINTGLGYPWRNYLFMLVRSAGTRANGELDWPDPLLGLKFEANMLLLPVPAHPLESPDGAGLFTAWPEH